MQSPERENFIPFRKQDLLQMCLSDDRLSSEEQGSYRELATLLESIFHFEFHEKLEELKDCYAPFDPDRDTRVVDSLRPQPTPELQQRLVAALREVLEKSNYEQVSQEELDEAMNSESLFRIRLFVDFEDFEEVLFFRRGVRERNETLKTWMGLRKQKIDVSLFERVAMYVKFKPSSYFEAKGRKGLLFEPGSTILKLFRNVPKADLEMLFPNTEVRMKPMDKVVMGVPAVAGGIAVIATKLGAVFALIASLIAFWLGFEEKEPIFDNKTLIALGVGLGTLAAYLFKQWNKYKNRKIKFMKTLTDNLYFKNLDNNAGVFHHLIDSAEEEECKESLLAYFFLEQAEEPLSEEELDKQIESWFREKWDTDLDFEVDDALQKLERLGLAQSQSQRWSALPLDAAKARLDEIWDHYFEFHQPKLTN
ncbi:MAG: hypothetical protein CSA62_12975 [Planctomycetota bacterium]|nr:MAG: hypothetical protein CSA62_12975 [Planctomycetota bacterium]